MQFQIAPLDFSQFGANFADISEDSAFANVFSREFNRIKHEDGRLIVLNNGQELMKTASLYVVIAAFQHDDFNKARRQWYQGTWSPTQEAGKKPDCQSFDGVAPDEGVAMPQSATCAACPHSQKGADGYTGCGYRKNFVMHICKVDPQTGAANVDTDTAYVFDASSKSMYSEYEQTTQSGGTHRIIPLLRKSGVTAIEAIVFELGFHQGSKAPVIKPVGTVPADVARTVIANAKQEATKALLAPIGAKTTPALAAPAAAPVQQLAAPVQQAQVQQAPVQQAPVQQVAPVVQQQPVVAQTQQAWAPTVDLSAQQAAMASTVQAQQQAAVQQAPVQQAAPVAQAAPAGNRAKALGAFSSLIGTK